MIIVCDASPLIALATCQGLDLLEQIFQEVYVSQEVYDEVTQENKPFATELTAYLTDKIYPIDLNINKINQNSNNNNLYDLDLGELSAFYLYQNLQADYLLIDEKLGRKIAKELEIKIIGSLGILVLAKQQGYIAEIAPFVEKLANSPIFISQSLINSTLSYVGETPI